MAIRNNHWYDINEQRYYPLDDTASAMSNGGELLPSGLLADLRLRWPVDYGRYAFISAVAITPYLVTLLIEATSTLDNSPRTSVLIAGFTLPKSELLSGRTYALTTFRSGVGGFVVIGSDFTQSYSGEFSSPRQSLLTARAAIATRRPPVTSIAVESAATSLSGLVNLVAIAPLTLSKESRVIDNRLYHDVIVFRLVEPATSVFALGVKPSSVFASFAGPCGQRVGSKSCLDPQPVQAINGVTPDCSGVITLEFKGCTVVGKNTNDCGVVVDCNLGLSSSCSPPHLPELVTGNLPSEQYSIIIPPLLPVPVPVTPPPLAVGIGVTPGSGQTLMTLPYCDTFPDSVATSFSPVGTSLFTFSTDSSPAESFCCVGPPTAATTYGCPGTGMSYTTSVGGASGRQDISLFTLDAQTLYREYTTDIKILFTSSLQAGVGHNAGIVLNCKLATDGSASFYLLAKLDISTSIFGIYMFNGVSTVALVSVPVRAARYGEWYRLTFKAVPNTITGTSVNLRAQLVGITNPTLGPITLTTSLAGNIWVSDSARAGLHAQRSRSLFSFWRIDEVAS